MASGRKQDDALRKLRDWIAAQADAPGMALPPLRELSVTLRVNRMTLNRAVLQLTDEGLIRRHGVKSFSLPGTAQSAKQQPVLLVLTGGFYRATGHEGDRGYANRAVTSALEQAEARGWHARQVRLGSNIHPTADIIGSPAPQAIVALVTDPIHQPWRGWLDAQRAAGVAVALLADGLPAQDLPPGWDVVLSDHGHGRRQLVEWLYQHGRTRLLGMFWGSKPDQRGRLLWQTMQEDGFRNACRNLGLPLLPPLIIPRLFHLDPAAPSECWVRMIAGFLLDRLHGERAPDAILAPTDLLVPIIAQALRLHGVDPQQCWITGYDGYAWSLSFMPQHLAAAQYEPPVSVELHGERTGEMLVDLALDRCAGILPATAVQRLVPMRVITKELAKNATAASSMKSARRKSAPRHAAD